MKQWTQATKGTHFLWFPVPASTAIPFVLLLFKISLWTFLFALSVAVFQAYMKAKGRTFLWAVRKFKSRLAGHTVQARTVWYRRRMQRRDSFDLISLEQAEKS